jgi:hypothetical protein
MSAQHINPNQLQLLINPTEHIARMHSSTDAYGLSTDSYSDSYGGNNGGYGDYEYAHNAGDNPAPTGTMRKLWQGKEGEALEPEGSYAHGSGMYDLIASGEQIRNPVQVNMGMRPETDVQYEGHHRVAAGHAVQRDTGRSVWLPIQYNENYHVRTERERKEREYTAHIESIKAQRAQPPTPDPNRPKRFSGMTSA